MTISRNRRRPRTFIFSGSAAILILSLGIVAVAQAASAAVSPAPGSNGIDAIWQQHADQPELSWRDPTSHARVVRVTGGFDSARLPYFHQNVFTAKGDLMLFSGRHGQDDGYFTLNLHTAEIRQLSHQTGANLVVLPRRRAAAFRRGDNVFLLNLDSGEERTLVTVPHDLLAEAAGFGFTADESKLLFAYCDQLYATHLRVTATPQKDIHVRRVDYIAEYEKMPKHNAIYSIDLDSGKLTPVFKDEQSNWLGHVQGSPTNPNLAVFIHEGFVSVHIKNRLRLLDVATGKVTMPRTGELENDGITHEFWDRDGKSVWYDISTAGALTHLDLGTGVETRYAYRTESSVRGNRSIHYVIGPDARWAVGDGFQGDNPWLYLYRLDRRDPQTQAVPVERLCDFSAHYNNPNAAYLEPNPHLTPDARWVLFTAHLKGNANQLYAVEIPDTAGAGR
jgi:oligogalacturonide lyase